MRVIIYGGRDYTDVRQGFELLDEQDRQWDIREIVSGMAPGADRIGAYWAQERGKQILRFYADWEKFGHRAAGVIRNRQMLLEGRPQLGLEFPGGTGTAHMRQQLESMKIPVVILL